MLKDRTSGCFFLHQDLRRSSQVESQVGSRGDEEISSARSNFFPAAHDDDLSTLESTHVWIETWNVSSPRNHTNPFSLLSFCKGTEDRECPRPACTLSSFTSSVSGMMETTNAQTTESILDSNMNLCTINKSTPWLASCLASCLASWTFVIVSALQDVAMVPARKSHQQDPKGADFARCWNNLENHTMQTWWILCRPWRLQTNSPSRRHNIIHINQHPPETVYSGISSWKTLTREAPQIWGIPPSVLTLILKSFQRAPASGQTRPS